jgi:DNA-binding beta-propeller fold protein YncE
LVACSGDSQSDARHDAPAALRHVGTFELPGVEGRFDHFAADVKGNRLFVAALGNNTVEVFDTAQAKHVHSIKGLHKPTGVAFVPEADRLVVANGDDGTVRFFDAVTLAPAGQIQGLPDADNVRSDAKAARLYVGYGEGALAVIDPAKPQKLADIKLDAHPESFQLETGGNRIFVNVPGAKHVAVIDRQTNAMIAKWPLIQASANFPMALNERDHRLFVGCRQPAKLLVIDTETGKTVASPPCAGDADDLFYDAPNRRIYVSGGEGVVSILRQTSPDQYEPLANVKTAAGARTSFFIPQTATLYVAVPHRGARQAELRMYQGQPAER